MTKQERDSQTLTREQLRVMLESGSLDFSGYDLSSLRLADLDFSDSICWQTNFSSSESQRAIFKGARYDHSTNWGSINLLPKGLIKID